TMFGSARMTSEDPNYALAERFAEIMADRKWGVVTGAGPGIMEAGNRGAGLDASYGVNIRLPFESEANSFVTPEKTVNFKYFFTRKLGFVKESHAFVLFPGGFGTLDETFELLPLIQTGKSDLHPIVMIEQQGTGYWGPVMDFMHNVLAAKGFISENDGSLFTFTNDPVEAADVICRFYANFHSQRYVDGRLVLRLNQAPDPAQLEHLNDAYSDIVVEGRIEVIDPTPPELRDEDALECARVAFRFDRRQFGRLREMIDELNTLVATPEQVHPPSAFRTEQADRSF
ncbi:MAG: LOG family protein, partial [Acidimicrobiia bacterium]|nr:LOG family protein [Acidimicrobiia bacterium]